MDPSTGSLLDQGLCCSGSMCFLGGYGHAPNAASRETRAPLVYGILRSSVVGWLAESALEL